ncbi:hypothetical protein JK159_09290 [Weissella minor]|uniref:ImmA/IrrE family metallo-endopeptidase n=1 Tax=Weissella minor TaxID=1620 RepID=UPI001BAFAE91|nr:ImmA/IrrE family metallo-endopeptidase [Weissella minor]MBS0950540.1 hypothetical protein [Weissella minor]
MKNELPKSVSVNGIDYEIFTVDEIDSDPLTNGTIYYDKQLIYVKASLAPQRMKQVLLHEIVHAIFYESGIEDTEEEVDILSRVLFSATKNSNGSFPLLLL